MSKKQLIRCVKKSKEAKEETNSSAHKKVLQIAGQMNCPICPPWKGENKIKRSQGKRGAKKPRYKDKR
jgi:hypothetical protein